MGLRLVVDDDDADADGRANPGTTAGGRGGPDPRDPDLYQSGLSEARRALREARTRSYQRSLELSGTGTDLLVEGHGDA
jgi:hypothetical protein